MLPRTRRPGNAGSLRLGLTRPGSSRTWRTMAHPPRSLLLTPPLAIRPSLLCMSIAAKKRLRITQMQYFLQIVGELLRTPSTRSSQNAPSTRLDDNEPSALTLQEGNGQLL